MERILMENKPYSKLLHEEDLYPLNMRSFSVEKFRNLKSRSFTPSKIKNFNI